MRGLAVLAAATAVWVLVVGIDSLTGIRVPNIRPRIVALAIGSGLCAFVVAFALLGTVARYADISEHGASDEERERAGLLLNLLTPIAKTFPAERGFEANVLAVQVHGGYGYTSEYLPEA